jgi:hypothetical protein
LSERGRIVEMARISKSTCAKGGASVTTWRKFGAVVAGGALVLLVLASSAGQGAAAAISSAVCTDKATLGFSPALKYPAVGGTVSESTVRTCTTATVNTAPLGESVQVSTTNWSGSYPYFGNCALALFSIANGEGILLGGVVNVNVHGLGAAIKVLVLTPNGVCNESSASGRGVVVLG